VLGEVVAFAPGRVNLIGEHTDYNLGLALPFAIDDGITVRATRLRQRRVEAFALDFGDSDGFALDAIAPAAGWRAFVRGAAAELMAVGIDVPGAELQITGTLPVGSGLSSSAALAVALCLALLAISGADKPSHIELAKICSRIERRWASIQSGLLDQLAAICGERERAMLIDFRSLEIRRVGLQLEGHIFVILDSGTSHSNSSTEEGLAAVGYNRRRTECATACDLLGLTSLRDARASVVPSLPAPLARRVRHVIGENDRVTDTVRALGMSDFLRVGELLNESHASLRDCYEVSTPAVEDTVRRLLDAGALGARVLGGGFGGYVLGMMPPGVDAPAGALSVFPGPGANVRGSHLGSECISPTTLG
jgi:galactokinase